MDECDKMVNDFLFVSRNLEINYANVKIQAPKSFKVESSIFAKLKILDMKFNLKIN